MIFQIERTSCSNEIRPCEEAVFEDGRWVCEINSLEKLIEFATKHGELIFNKDLSIEIYDDWRE